jgi:hypothetical protein
MTWELLHRGREGDDSMRVLIGDATTADVGSDDGWDFISADLTDGTAGWGGHSDVYVVPDGQTCTRFAFRAVSTASGSASIGNLLDAVSFSIPVPPTPTPDPTAAPTADVTPPPTSAEPLPQASTESTSALIPAALLVVAWLLTLGLTRRRLGR